MHHKRGWPKRQRAGCLWCEAHKVEREPKLVRLKGLKAPRRVHRADVASTELN